MSDWTQGYITEIEYTAGFYRELAPAYLRWCAVIKGHEAPAFDGSFHYLEVGCGQGVSAVTLAASNPQGRFWAFDFNPAHVRHAQALASAAQLTNIEVFEASFAEARTRGLPPMDVIALHGVYSWITPQNRQEIVALIRDLLKPGGLVYISYNCLPGWAAKAPVRKLMTEYAARSSGHILARFSSARDALAELSQNEALFFKSNPAAAALAQQIKNQSPNYLVHEYLNAAWELLYHSDVARELHDAKLSFIANATVLENFDEASVPAGMRARIAQEKDPVLAELLRDFAANRQFRRDLFARGAQRLGASEALAQIGATRFALARERSLCDPKVQIPLGEATLNAELFAPIMDALAAGDKSAAELAQAAGKPLQAIVFMLSALIGVGYIVPLLSHEPDAAPAQRLNRVLLGRAAAGRELLVLAAPRAGTGVGASHVDQLFLLAALEGAQDPAQAVHERLLALNRRLLDANNQPLNDPAQQQEQLRARHATFADQTLPIWRRLGCVPA